MLLNKVNFDKDQVLLDKGYSIMFPVRSQTWTTVTLLLSQKSTTTVSVIYDFMFIVLEPDR